MDPNERKHVSRAVPMAIAASSEALECAGMDSTYLAGMTMDQKRQIGVLLGAGGGAARRLHHFRALTPPEVRAYVQVNPNTQCAKLRAATSFQFSANERRHSMFTRVVEITAKSGKAHELANTIQERSCRS